MAQNFCDSVDFQNLLQRDIFQDNLPALGGNESLQLLLIDKLAQDESWVCILSQISCI